MLKDINYKVNITCGLCKHSEFVQNRMWGLCKKFKYQHLKHTDSERDLSVHRCGKCPHGEISDEGLIELGKFSELIRKNTDE